MIVLVEKLFKNANLLIAWEARLTGIGRRITASRRAVMQTLRAAEAPLLPQEILGHARTIHRPLGLVTVYRTLNLLTELNLVRRVHREDGCHAYVLASPGHHAVICERCGRALEFAGGNDLNRLFDHLEEETGYEVKDHLLQVLGLCPVCQDEPV